MEMRGTDFMKRLLVGLMLLICGSVGAATFANWATTNANPVAPILNGGTGTNASTLWVDPNGSDSFDGLSPERPKKTFGGAAAANRAGYTIHFLRGTYLVTNTPISLTNGSVIAEAGVVVDSGVNAIGELFDIIAGTNTINGGTWRCTNGANGVFSCADTTETGILTLTISGVSAYGEADVLYGGTFGNLNFTLTGDYFESVVGGIDTTQVDGADTNSTFTVTGCTFVSRQRVVAVNQATCNISGNNFLIVGSPTSSGVVEIGASVVNWSGNNIFTYDQSQLFIHSGSGNTYNFTGHPYPDSKMSFNSDTVNFKGWGDLTGVTLITNLTVGGKLILTNNADIRGYVTNSGTAVSITLNASSTIGVTGATYFTNNVFANSLILGNVTNTATGTLIQTNFISGKLYTNIYGRPISISANATLTTAGVSGNSSLALLASGYLTNYSGLSTIVTSIASSYTNVISMVIPASQTYTFTNTSAGAGDSASVTGGQILVQ